MQRVFEVLGQVSATNATVLILGESGTGKELVARAIHENSPRKERRFVAVNCAALSEGLIESELFGHVKGAFTGAVAGKEGRIVYADGGTLFLDEVGDMPLATQAKLLRVLETREVQPVGGNQLQQGRRAPAGGHQPRPARDGAPPAPSARTCSSACRW